MTVTVTDAPPQHRYEVCRGADSAWLVVYLDARGAEALLRWSRHPS